MSYPTQPSAGPAQPVSIVTSGVTQGGIAIPVYGYSSQPTDRPVLGGPSQRVKVLSAGDLIQNGGTYSLSGSPYGMPLYTAPAATPVIGGPAIPVYPINTWGNWWAADGVPTPYVIYQAKGASGYSGSKLNLANPGTNDAVDGNAFPSWNSTDGWVFDGVDDYLKTINYTTSAITVLVRYTGASWHAAGFAFRVLFGVFNNSSPFQNISVTEYSDNKFYWDNEGENNPGLPGGTYNTGVVGIAGAKGFFNGVLKAAIPNSGSGVLSTRFISLGASTVITLGTLSVTFFLSCSIQAVAIWLSVLTDAQVAAVSAAMALL